MVMAEAKMVADGLGHFPSKDELDRLGRSNLSNQLTRRGGFVFWTAKCGYQRIISDSDYGWAGEKLVSEMLQNRGHNILIKEGVKSPYDLIVDDVLRIDVKTAKKMTYQHVTGWFYRIGKYVQSDVVILLQSDTKDIFILPWWECVTSNITLSITGGKYAKFKNRFDILNNMIVARKNERLIASTP